jgi:leader peptidase (prepilin peptidase) / N-methyltransferase
VHTAKASSRCSELYQAVELIFVVALVALAAIDLDRRILPNRIVYPLAGWGVAATALVDPGRLPEHLAAGAGAFTLLLVAALIHPPGMGMGDVKLAGAMGVCLGLAVVPAMLVAFVTGSLAGALIVRRTGIPARDATLPFGVFLALGGVVAVLLIT